VWCGGRRRSDWRRAEGADGPAEGGGRRARVCCGCGLRRCGRGAAETSSGGGQETGDNISLDDWNIYVGLHVNGPRLGGLLFTLLLLFQVPDGHPRGRYKTRTRPDPFRVPKPAGRKLHPPPPPPGRVPAGFGSKPDPLPSLVYYLS
jgi:hypothetical protein